MTLEQHVFGPDVGQRLWLALKAAPSLEITDPTPGIDWAGPGELVLQSQGMKTLCDSQGAFHAAQKRAPK